MHKPYYDHDSIWAERAKSNNPIWGSYSHTVYNQVLKLISEIHPNAKQLFDAGCGAGAFGEKVKAGGYEYYGVDASGEAIALGEKKFPDLNLKCLDLAKSVVNEEFKNGFDIITCINVLHCLVQKNDRNAFLKNIRQLIKQDGFLILSTMIGPIKDNLKDQRIPRTYLPKEEILAELSANGWSRLVYEFEEIPNERSPIGNLMVACCLSTRPKDN